MKYLISITKKGRSKNKFGIINLLLLVVFLLVSQGNAQDVNLLKLKIGEVKVYEGNITFSLNTLASKYRVPIGEIPLFNERRNSTMELQGYCLRNKSLEEVLNAIVASNPEYTWTVDNHVVNFIPALPQNSYPFLDIKIKNFKVDNLTVGEIKLKIALDDSVTATLNAQGIVIKELGLLPTGESAEERVSFQLENASVRDIFNYLVKNTKKRHWTISRWGDREQNIWIMFS